MSGLVVSPRTLRALQALLNTTQARTVAEHRSSLSAARNALARIDAAAQARAARAERCQRDLYRCLASDRPSCSYERSELREAERLLSVAQEARRIARQAITDYDATANATLKKLDVILSQGQVILTVKLDRVSAVNARGAGTGGGAVGASGVIAGGSIGSAVSGGGLIAAPGLPAGFALVPVSLIDQSENPITGPDDFGKGYSIEDLDYAFDLFESEVLPGLAGGATADTFSATDHANGIQGMRSLSDTFHGFLGHDAVRLEPKPDGRYSITNGRHRTYVATQYGRQYVPAFIVGGKP